MHGLASLLSAPHMPAYVVGLQKIKQHDEQYNLGATNKLKPSISNFRAETFWRTIDNAAGQ